MINISTIKLKTYDNIYSICNIIGRSSRKTKIVFTPSKSYGPIWKLSLPSTKIPAWRWQSCIRYRDIRICMSVYHVGSDTHAKVTFLTLLMLSSWPVYCIIYYAGQEIKWYRVKKVIFATHTNTYITYKTDRRSR